MAFLNNVNTIIIICIVALSTIFPQETYGTPNFRPDHSQRTQPCVQNGVTIYKEKVGTIVENGVANKYLCKYDRRNRKNILHRYACKVEGVWKPADTEFTHPPTGEQLKCAWGMRSLIPKMELQLIGCCYTIHQKRSVQIGQPFCDSDTYNFKPGQTAEFQNIFRLTNQQLYDKDEYYVKDECTRVDGKPLETYWKTIGCYAIEHEADYVRRIPKLLTKYVQVGKYVDWRGKNWTCKPKGTRATVVSTLK